MKTNRQLAQLQEELQQYEQLYKILETLGSAYREDEVIQRVIEDALSLCRADEAAIVLFDPTTPEQAKTLLRSREKGPQLLDRYLNHLLAGWVSKHSTALLSQAPGEALGEDNLSGKYRRVSSVLSVPLPARDMLIGVINLISNHPEQPLGVREEQLMSLLAAHCARFIHAARLQEELFAETARLKRALAGKYDLQGIVGNSPPMRKIFALLEHIVPTTVRVLIQGESGTGKELIARLLHYNGPQKDAPFVTVDCGALPANLLESELFGYRKGAFTGATQDRKGLFEEADGGTLFLDEIGNMTLEIQAKLLRAIQEGEIRPLGANQTRRVSVRILAATGKNLSEEVQQGRFREDLYYRLNVMNVPLPPLRERREDIPLLAIHFLTQHNQQYGKRIRGFTPQCLRYLEAQPWPGNIRELEHAIERAVILCQTDQLTIRDFPDLSHLSLSPDEALFHPRPLQQALTDFKTRFIEQVLKSTGGKQTTAADILKIQRTYLNRLIRELGIKS